MQGFTMFLGLNYRYTDPITGENKPPQEPIFGPHSRKARSRKPYGIGTVK